MIRVKASWAVRLLVAAVPLGFGCAHSDAFQPLNRAALRASNPSTLLIRAYPPPPFGGGLVKFMFPVGVLPTLIAMAVTGTATPDDLDHAQLRDPAIAMRADLANAMGSRFSVQVLGPLPMTITERGREKYWHPAGGRQPHADLILDVRTTYWGVIQTRAGHYAAKYTGTIILTDSRTGKVVARSTCEGNPLDDPSNPTFDELKAAGPARLRAMFREAGDYCFQDYRKRVLGLY